MTQPPHPRAPQGDGSWPPPHLQPVHDQGPTSGGWSPPPPDAARPSGDDLRPPEIPRPLTDSTLLQPNTPVSERGWRKTVRVATFGTVSPGPSKAERADAARLRAIRTPINGCHRVGVLSIKGGVGKSTVSAGLGLALSIVRGDGVAVLDNNPDAGTLAERLVGPPPAITDPVERVGNYARVADDVWVVSQDVRDLLSAVRDDRIRSAADVMRYMSITGRLHVLASDQKADTVEPFNDEEYRLTASVLEAFYAVLVTDSGTGLRHSAVSGMLTVADSLVIVAGAAVDKASRAAKTLDWLVAQGFGDLVRRAVVVICHTQPRHPGVDADALTAHFATRCRGVLNIPYEPQLVPGGIIRWEQLSAETRSAFLDLAAAIAGDFGLSWSHR